MELASNEIQKINRLIEDWLAHPEQELESTFGHKGEVDATTFLSIAKRLQAKGYVSIPQDDRLSAFLVNAPGMKQESNIRLSLQGLGILQNYCKTNEIRGTDFTALIKDATSLEANLDLSEYEMRIKTRREIPLKRDDPAVKQMIDGWRSKLKAFRLIKRWSFEGHGIRIDMSMVRSSPKDSAGNFKGQKNFIERNVNLFTQIPVYEVEVELIRDETTNTLDKAKSCFIRGIGEILRAIQKNTLLIRKTIRETVLADYYTLVGSKKFVGVAPVTLEKDNFRSAAVVGEPNIRNNYNVTDKADGLRCMGFCDEKGELFMIDMGLNIYRTGQASPLCANSLVDGEWVTADKDKVAINHLLLFDIYRATGNQDVTKLPFAAVGEEVSETRWAKLTAWAEAWVSGKKDVARGITETTRLQVARKEFSFARAEDPLSIFAACADVLRKAHSSVIYHTDGLILTPNDKPIPAGSTFFEQFKWKPAIDNSIDFLVKFEKDPERPLVDRIVQEIDPDTRESRRYKVMRLYVGTEKNPALDDPRATILNKLPLPDRHVKKGRVFQPTLFYPTEYPDSMANICHVPVEESPETGEDYAVTENAGEPIRQNSIVECRYEPQKEAGWRWIPMRVRHDKTDRYAKGVATRNISRTLNAQKTADSVWNSIHDPITESMIMTGSDYPTAEESALLQRDSSVYYKREASKSDLMVIRGLRDFHNHYVKELLLYKPILRTADGGGGKKLLDLACGQGADLRMWIENKPAFVLGTDIAGEGIRDPENGAYSRLLFQQMKLGKEAVPPILFVIANSSQSLIDGEAGATKDEKNMLRSVFGKASVEGPLPPLVETELGGMMRSGADAAVMMFALHYMCKDKETLDGFLKNLADCVRVGGYFAGCCTDGDQIMKLLHDTRQGQTKSGMDKETEIWSIRKDYDVEELLADDSSLGQPIGVKFMSLGSDYKTEYLVNFDYLTLRLREIGFELLTPEDMKTMGGGLKHSTNLFSNTYKSISNAATKYPMKEAVMEFSFLSRWFIFKRRGEADTLPEGGWGLKEGEGAAGAAAEGEAPDASFKPHVSAEAPLMADVAAAAAAAGAENTVVDLFHLPDASRRFEAAELFTFGPEVALKDSLKVGDDRSTRWLAPYWQFRVIDPEEEGVFYPSLEHFWEAMKIKHLGKKPGAAKTLLSTEGTIHQSFLPKYDRKAAESEKAYKERVMEIMVEELEEVKKQTTNKALAKFGISIDDAEWAVAQEPYLRSGLEQRWVRDKLFRQIVEAAKEKGKYLLYYLKGKKLGGSLTGPLAGRRSAATGQIEGGNLIGQLIMEIAGFKID